MIYRALVSLSDSEERRGPWGRAPAQSAKATIYRKGWIAEMEKGLGRHFHLGKQRLQVYCENYRSQVEMECARGTGCINA